MKDRLDKRRYRRLPTQYRISCRKVGSIAGKSSDGRTVNVSSGGLYFEAVVGEFKQGDLLKLALEIPPTAGLLEFGGKLTGYANVLRTESMYDDRASAHSVCGMQGVALQFCRPPKLCI